MISFLIGLITFLGSSTTIKVDHALFISVLEIEQSTYDKQKGTIRIKLFANDLEDALYNFSKKRINLLETDCLANKNLISNYFNVYLKVSINGKLLEYKYLSCEINDISLWLFFDFDATDEWKNMNISASYLMELFPTQSNVMSVTVSDNKKLFRFTKDKPEQFFNFK